MNAYQDVQTSGNNCVGVRDGVLNHVNRENRGGQWYVQPRTPAILESLEEQMAVVTAELMQEQESTLSAIQRNYVLPIEKSSVRTFLTEHRALPQLLVEAKPHLKECFGEESITALRTVADEAGSRTLYAVVIWPGAVDEVRECLARFDETWWVAHARQASGYVVFTYELI